MGENLAVPGGKTHWVVGRRENPIDINLQKGFTATKSVVERHIIGFQRPAIPGGYIKATETGKNSSSPSFHEVAPVSHDGLGEVPQGGAII